MSPAGLVRAAPHLLVFDGQSLNGQPNNSNSYPNKLMLNRNIPYYQVWIGGAAWAQLDDNLQTRAFRQVKGAVKAIYMMLGGTTDLAVGVTGINLDITERAICDSAKAAGFYKVINTTTTKWSGMTGGQDTERIAANNLTMANAGAKFDGVVDLAGTAGLSDNTNATYYVDQTHWTATGAQLAADTVAPVLDAVLAA